jgi:hypothetical protein
MAPDASPRPGVDAEGQALGLSGGRAKRMGDALSLKLANGKSLKLSSQPKNCELDNVDHCVIYRFVADLPTRHAYLVDEGYYEGGDILLIDDRTGRRTVLPGIPIFGPTSQELISIDNCVAYGGDYDLQVWKRAGDHFVVEWRHVTEPLTDEVDEEVVSWSDPDRIALRFKSTGSTGGPSYQWSGALVRKQGAWRLEAKVPEDLLPRPQRPAR